MRARKQLKLKEKGEQNQRQFLMLCHTCSMFNEACQSWKRMMKFPLNNSRENIQHAIRSDSANLSNFHEEVSGCHPRGK